MRTELNFQNRGVATESETLAEVYKTESGNRTRSSGGSRELESGPDGGMKEESLSIHPTP